VSPRLPRMTAIELIKALRRDGWERLRQRGSHIILTHSIKTGRVTVPMHSKDILRLKTLESILDQAELTIDDLNRLR